MIFGNSHYFGEYFQRITGSFMNQMLKNDTGIFSISFGPMGSYCG
jgi:hypothetical protein